MRILRKYLMGALAIIASLMVTAQASRADEMSDILQRGELRVAVQTQGPPISFVDKDGKRAGLAIDLAQMMADDLGVKLVLQDYNWEGLIPALKSGKVDMIAADLTPTPQRAAQLLFSKPIFYDETVAVTRTDAPYKTYQELNKEGISVGATTASTYASSAKTFLPKTQVKEYAATAATMQALSSGRVDAGVTGVGNARDFIKQFNNLKMLDGVLSREPLAFAVQPNAFHLKMWLDNYVDLISANHKLDERLHYWWESGDWEKDHK